MTIEFNAIDRIKALCEERNYSYYELAKQSKIPYSTLNTMLLKNNSPTLPTLCKLCEGFGISLVQFFEGQDGIESMTETQRECLQLFSCLNPDEQQLAIAYIKGLLHKL